MTQYGGFSQGLSGVGAVGGCHKVVQMKRWVVALVVPALLFLLGTFRDERRVPGGRGEAGS